MLRSVTIPPLRRSVYVAIGPKGHAALRKRFGIDEAEPPRVDGRTYDLTFGAAVYLPGEALDATLPAVAGVVAHEADHALDYIFEQVGERQRTDELRAYFLEHTVVGICNVIEKARAEA